MNTKADQVIHETKAWVDRIGATLVTMYKGLAIHRNGIAVYVNGFYVGTTVKRAKAYINGTDD